MSWSSMYERIASWTDGSYATVSAAGSTPRVSATDDASSRISSAAASSIAVFDIGADVDANTDDVDDREEVKRRAGRARDVDA